MEKEKKELFDNYNKILKKAEYCLNCHTRPCEKQGCPMNTKIPNFIELIKVNKIKDAYNVLRSNNIFSHICSIICPQEDQCEGKCVRGIKNSPTEIGLLEEYVNYIAEKEKYDIPELEKKKENGYKVAIIGSGPAGLECAYELKKSGCQVDIFEKEEKNGGILEYGIPDFRLNKKYIEEIIEYLKDIGISFYNNKEFGIEIHIEDLKKKYDAIFLGIGAEVSSKYDLGDFSKIYDSNEFLRAYYSNNYLDKLGKVIVIGGGNVAMDCSRVALKMGATSSTICYRRDEKHMPARKEELYSAIADGVKKQFLTRVISANGENKIEKLHCIKTKIIDGKASDIENSDFEIEADSVVFAIGLKPNKKILSNEKLKVTDWGILEVDKNNMTSIEGVFAGGDLIESKATVCRALASGRKAALDILNYLKEKEN